MITAEFRVVPVGSGSSMKDEIQKVVKALDKTGIHYDVGPLATSIEADSLDKVFDAIKDAHDALAKDVPRINMEISIDHRLDKEETLSTLTAGKRENEATAGPFA